MNRTTELILGIVGGIFGMIGGIMAIFLGGAFDVLGASDAGTMIGTGSIAIIVSIIGLIGGIIAKNKSKLAGIFMIAAAIIGFICIFMFYIIPGILLLIGGILCFVRKG